MLYADGSSGGPSPTVELWYDELFGAHKGPEWSDSVVNQTVHDAATSQEGPFLRELIEKRAALANRLTQDVSKPRYMGESEENVQRTIENYCSTLGNVILAAGKVTHRLAARHMPTFGIRIGHATQLAGQEVLATEASARMDAIDVSFSQRLPHRDLGLPFHKQMVRRLLRFCGDTKQPSDILWVPYQDQVKEKPDAIIEYGKTCGNDFRDAMDQAVHANLENDRLLDVDGIVNEAVENTVSAHIDFERSMVNQALHALRKEGL